MSSLRQSYNSCSDALFENINVNKLIGRGN